MKKRVFSAVRPSGELQLGNYLGAISQWVEMSRGASLGARSRFARGSRSARQDEFDCVFAIADYHAITTEYNPESFQQKIKDHLLFYLAAGIDPKKCTLFIQSQNPNHTELAWILETITTTSELKRMTQFKEKSAQGGSASGGEKVISAALFNYPVLMAADILLYQTDVVPVGEDQKQHVEIAADIAKRFNHRFGEVFKIPQVKLVKEANRIMSLTDPSKKMSKSGEDKARINLSDPDDVIIKKIMSAVTDSGKEIEYSEDKPAIANLLRIYSACSGEPIEEIVSKFKNKGYADFKNKLAEVIIKKIGPIREKKIELEKDEELYQKIIFEGLEKAEIISRRTIEAVKKSAGLI
ncbi:MAG: tryptophanyl-tRNA synthetase [Candidatus Berkelbacteria bacterium Licking1014_96]|uniref:Tryptophan--tRNA ligase n=1 Tax=Candidatus Berkelbacteria bacterium Licking1014_96 TaxID=2017149 RepID=A0A554LFK1_9BACT|nr:MAG: tryptophanyl-tRNA synthetase [Candidatus Berkelbacteria bacterium Licking1014_96]